MNTQKKSGITGETVKAKNAVTTKGKAGKPTTPPAPKAKKDGKAAESLFWQAANEKRLVMDETFAKDASPAPPGEFCPARHALVCALMGMHKRPWRDPGP